MEHMKSLFRRTSILLGERHTSVYNRFTAKAIDLLVVVAIYFLGKALWSPLGVVMAVVLCGFGDGMGAGQSIGKRVIGLRVIDDPTGVSCSFQAAFSRNFPFVLCVIFAALPFFWVFLILLGIPLVAVEIYLLLTLDSGVRLGDVLANTLVIEYLEDSLAVPSR